MIKRMLNWLTVSSAKSKVPAIMLKLGALIFVIAPIAIIIFRDYRLMEATSYELTISRRATITHLAATKLEEKFDGLVDLGIAVADQELLQQYVKAKAWDEAIALINDIPASFPYIENVSILESDGTLKAAAPAVPELIGKNYSHRDYYQGVSKTWEPYVSGVFKRAAKPQFNVIVVAIPIKSIEVGSNQTTIHGILALAINLDTILKWTSAIEVGEGGYVYFVDQAGNVAGHPKFSKEADPVNFSEVEVVSKVLKGETGVAVNYNQIDKEERLSGYEPVAKYGWGAIAQQPTSTALELSRMTRTRFFLESIAIGFASLALVFFLIQVIFKLSYALQEKNIFLESVADGLVGIDRAWNITLWNKAATTLTGWSEAEVLGKPFREIVQFVSEVTGKENIGFIEEAMLFGKVKTMENHTVLVQKNGKKIFVSNSVTPIFNQNSAIVGSMIVFRDTSEEHELKKNREEFTALATHQLRTPISVINAYLELLKDEAGLPEQAKSELTAITKAATGLNDLVNDMLNVSRIENRTIGIEPEPCYLPDVIHETITELLPKFTAKNIAISELHAKGLPSVQADPKITVAIIKNLLSNALKFTPDKGEIKVSVKLNKKTGEQIISVADNGIGIPADEQQKIFSKFYRAENARVEDIEGAGLGLYIIKAIMNLASGRVWFESKENAGSTFYVAIPPAGMTRIEGNKGLT